MKVIFFLIGALGIVFPSYSQHHSPMQTTGRETGNDSIAERMRGQTKSFQETVSPKDREEIRHLIRQVLKWADSKNGIEVLPVLKDSRDGVYVGFDLNGLKSNLDKLRATGLFANEFIENYNRIILTLDKKLRNGESGVWPVGEFPPFRFANGINPWCDCQDIPYDRPNPWELVETEVLRSNDKEAEVIWKWGGLGFDASSGWKDFLYRFRVVKEKGQWKIAYLQGFDFEESTQGDG